MSCSLTAGGILVKVLQIALTSRDKKREDSIPMCGVPYRAYEAYLNKLTAAGYKVAICEQMEDPELVRARRVHSPLCVPFAAAICLCIPPASDLGAGGLNAKGRLAARLFAVGSSIHVAGIVPK